MKSTDTVSIQPKTIPPMSTDPEKGHRVNKSTVPVKTRTGLFSRLGRFGGTVLSCLPLGKSVPDTVPPDTLPDTEAKVPWKFHQLGSEETIVPASEVAPPPYTAPAQTISLQDFLTQHFGTNDLGGIKSLFNTGLLVAASMGQQREELGVHGPMTRDAWLNKLPQWTEAQMEELYKAKSVNGHTALHDVSFLSLPGNEINEDHGVVKYYKDINCEAVTILDGHGGDKRKGEQGAASQELALNLPDEFRDAFAEAIRTNPNLRYDKEAIAGLLKTVLITHDAATRTADHTAGAVGAGTWFDRVTNTAYTWGVGDCRNFMVFKDKKSGKYFAKSTIELHTTENPELVERLNKSNPEAISGGRWYSNLQPLKFFYDNDYKPGGSRVDGRGAATLDDITVSAFDLKDDEFEYIASVLASDGLTLGIEPTKYNEDVTERLGEKITEMVVSQLESGPDARKLFEEGKVHQEIRAIGSAETRGIRDDTTVMLLYNADGKSTRYGSDLGTGFNTAHQVMVPTIG